MSEYKRKIYFKVKIDEKTQMPFFIGQDMFINTATKNDVEKILKKWGIDNEDILNDFFSYFKNVYTKINFAWHPTFLSQSSWESFFSSLKKELTKFSRATITIKDKKLNEKKWPVAIFALYQYWE